MRKSFDALQIFTRALNCLNHVVAFPVCSVVIMTFKEFNQQASQFHHHDFFRTVSHIESHMLPSSHSPAFLIQEHMVVIGGGQSQRQSCVLSIQIL